MLRDRVNTFQIVGAVVTLAVASFVAYPLARMVTRAFYTDGRVSLGAFADAFSDATIRRAALTTAVITVVATLIAVVIATSFAWANERTDARLGWMSQMLPVLPLLVPPLANVVGMVFLFAPRAGVVNVTIRRLVGSDVGEGPINLFSIPGLVILYALFMVPFVYLPISAGLRNLDASYEEASRCCGASVWTTARRVTLPAIKPAIISGTTLGVVVGLTVFSIPSIVGTSAGIDVLSVRVYRALNGEYPPKTDLALAISTVLMLVILMAVAVQRRVTRRAAFATISGRARPEARIALGKARGVVRAAMIMYVLISTVLPFGALLLMAIQPFWGPEIRILDGNVDSFRQVFFENETTQKALLNSALLGITGASFSVIVCTMIAIYVKRQGGLVGRLADGVTKVPAALSHLVIAVGFLIAFGGAPFDWQGTLTILFVAYFVMYLPQGSIVMDSAVSQIGNDLTEASAIAGATASRTFRRIQLPLLAPGAAAAWTLLFVLMAGDVTGSAILAGTNTPVVGRVILDEWSFGSFPRIAAMGVVMSVASMTVIGVAALIGGVRRKIGRIAA